MKYLTSTFDKVLLAYAVCGLGEDACSQCPYDIFKLNDKTVLCKSMVDRDKKIIEGVLEEIDAQEEKDYLGI